MTLPKVALDTHLNPTSNGIEYMKHLQFAKHYRELLMTLKKSGYLKMENIPLKEQYTTCLKDSTSDCGDNWELRVLAGSMSLTTMSEGIFILTQQGMTLEQYVESLGININSPTTKTVCTNIMQMKLITIQITKSKVINRNREKLRTRTRCPLGNIKRKEMENNYV